MGIQSLPAELLTDTLKCLGRPDLRSASSVCRRFRDAADHIGLYIHRSVNFDESNYLQQLYEFEYLAEHFASLPEAPTLSLAFSCVFPYTRLPVQQIMERIFSAIAKSLPVLGRLQALVPQAFSGALYAALRVPAPRLRVLALGQVNAESLDRPYDPFPRHLSLPRNTAVALPSDLFQQSAPRLREIVLRLPTLDPDWVPVAAFGTAERVNVNLYEPGPHLAFARFFPSARAFSVTVEPRSRAPAVPQRITADLRGLNLRYLAVSECLRPFVRLETPLRELRCSELIGEITFDEALWPKDDAARTADLHARLAQGIQRTTLAISPSHGAWTRAISPNAGISTPRLLLNNVPLMGTRLLSLVLPNALLVSFLVCPAVFTALANLFIDCTPCARLAVALAPCEPYGIAATQVQARCPALKTVSLVSVGPVKPPPVQVHAVVTLGKHLGQSARAESERAVLQLVGVRFAKEEQAVRARIVPLFSDVREGVYLVGDLESQFYRCATERTAFDLSNVFSTDRRLHDL